MVIIPDVRGFLSYLALFGLLLGICADVRAIAVADLATSEASPANAGYSFNWDYVYKYKNSSSVAVDHYWILTAAHVADDTFNGDIIMDGVTNYQQEVVFHSSADLALVRFDKPFPGYYALHGGEIYHTEGSGRNGVTVYDPLIMVGFGYTGIVTQTTFTQTDGTGTKRWGTNRGTSEITVNSTQCFKMTFDLSDTDYEAGANVNDSGGPVFIQDGVDWKLTGITLFRQPNDPPFTENYSAMIHDYIDWTTNGIPDYDTDMDGLPDWWETLYGGNATSMVASVDLDNDDFTNYEEWLADTVPTNGTSFLEILNESTPTNLVFSSSTNRKYQVEYRTDLVNTNEIWGIEEAWFDGASPQTGQSVSTVSSNRFYRVRAKLR